MYAYVKKHLNSKGKLINAENVRDGFIYEQLSDPDADYYSSIFCYNEEQKAQFDKVGSIAGITDVLTDRLYWDFDSADDLEQARKDALVVVSRLKLDMDPASIQIYFTGKKGFGIEVLTTNTYTVEEFGKIVDNYAADLNTFDKVVKNASRIIRIPLTRHQETGLYKIPLMEEQLEQLSIEDIKTLAKSNDYFQISYPRTDFIFVQNECPKKDNYDEQLEDIDMSKKPKWLTPARYVLQEGGFPRGMGISNQAYMILASTYKAQGFDRGATEALLSVTAKKQAARYNCETYSNKEISENICGVVYSDLWKGGIYNESEPLLQDIYEKYNLKQPKVEQRNIAKPIDAFFDSFRDFAENIDKNTIQLGIPEIDESPDIRITSQMVVGILGAPSSGKSTILIDILNSTSKRNIPSMLFQMDMGSNLMFQRLIQKHTGYSQKQLFSIYKSKDKVKIKSIQNILQDNYSNINFCFNTALSPDSIREAIETYQTESGIKVKLVAIDYLECIQGPYSDSIANTSFIAQKLKDIANDLNLTIVLLLQPPKSAGDPSNPLYTYIQIKGAATVAQAASVVFTVWRPGFSSETPENDKYLSMAVVKNRMGGLRTFDFAWEGMRGSINRLSPYEKQQLELLKEKQAEQRKDYI